MSETNITPVTTQDLEDVTYLFLMTVNSYIGFDKSGLEVAGAAHQIVSVAIQELNKKHEQTTGIREAASLEGITGEPGQVQESGTAGRIEESTEGDGETVSGSTPEDSPSEP